MNNDNVLITIDEAREILGERAKTMTDEEVNNLLNTMRLLCNKTIDAVVERK